MTKQSAIFKSRLSSLLRSQFSRNVIWVSGLAGVERIAALVQTVILARMLGITEYGIYGLLSGTIGFAGSVMGIQMGQTATILIAKYRDSEKSKAALAIQYIKRYAWAVSLLFIAVVLAFTEQISSWLLGSDRYTIAVAAGCLFVSVNIVSGVQDGVLQGFEDFKSAARIKIFTAILTLVGIYPVTISYGLEGVMSFFVVGVAVKFLLLQPVVAKHMRVNQIPRHGSGLRFADIIFKFSLPSMLLNMMIGYVSWYGGFLLSRQPNGFESVAIVNTGMQWRGPILLLANSIGSVAIPAFSRYSEQRDQSALDSLQRRLLWLNGTATTLVCLVLVMFSKPFLAMYGKGFSGGELVFSILVVTTIPQVISNIYMQNLVGAGKLWLQLWLNLFMLIPTGLAFVLLIPRYQGTGYAIAAAIGAVSFAICTIYLFGVRKRGKNI